jgi:hypothetical protein
MSTQKLNDALARADVILDDAFSQSNGPPLGYKESYHYDIRRQVLDFIQVSLKKYVSGRRYFTSIDHSHRSVAVDHFYFSKPNC